MIGDPMADLVVHVWTCPACGLVVENPPADAPCPLGCAVEPSAPPGPAAAEGVS